MPATNCRDCGTVLMQSNRVKTGNSRYTGQPKFQNRCKKCWIAYMGKWKKEHHTSPSVRGNKKRMLRWAYGVSMECYEAMLAAQGCKCAICGTEETIIDPRTGQARALAVDHDHLNTKVRGLLCSSCNRALGLLKHNKLSLAVAIAYLGAFDDI